MYSLGLDASTTTCGYSIVDENRAIQTANFIDLTKYETNREKAWAIINKLKTEPLFTKIDRVNMEAALSGFSGGGSRTTVVKLAKFNATIEYVLQDVFGMEMVHLVNATTARKQAFGKAIVRGIDSKSYVKSQVESRYDMTPWTIYNRIGNPDKRMEDILDSIVIALYSPN